jgi:hypothetical protein
VSLIDPLSEGESPIKLELSSLAEWLGRKGVVVEIVYSGLQHADHSTCGDMSLIMLRELVEDTSNRYRVMTADDQIPRSGRR